MKKSDDVKKFFHGYAHDFDEIYGRTSKASFLEKFIDKHFRKVMFLRMVQTLKNSAKDEVKSVLDIGCGPGRYCIEFLKQGKSVIAVDIAEGMLEIAKKRVEEVTDNKNIRFILGNYMDVAFKEKTDAACLMGLFDYIENPLELLKKLKQDVSKEIYASFPKSKGILAWQRRVRYKMRNCPLYMYTQKEVEVLLKDAGMDNYEIIDLGRGLFVKVVL